MIKCQACQSNVETRGRTNCPNCGFGFPSAHRAMPLVVDVAMTNTSIEALKIQWLKRWVTPYVDETDPAVIRPHRQFGRGADDTGRGMIQ